MEENTKKLKRKEFRIDDGQGNLIGDLVDISIVTEPAIEMATQFFNSAFSKKSEFKSYKDKQEITGPVMVPNRDILRQDEETGEYFYCWFTEDTIKKCLQVYVEQSNHIGSKIEHLGVKVSDIVTFENWIVEDPNNDKSNALGFTGIPKGTWMATLKVKDKELWEKLKASDFKGFSIEGSFGIFKRNTNEQLLDIEQIVDSEQFSDIEKKEAIQTIVDLYPEIVKLSKSDDVNSDWAKRVISQLNLPSF